MSVLATGYSQPYRLSVEKGSGHSQEERTDGRDSERFRGGCWKKGKRYMLCVCVCFVVCCSCWRMRSVKAALKVRSPTLSPPRLRARHASRFSRPAAAAGISRSTTRARGACVIRCWFSHGIILIPIHLADPAPCASRRRAGHRLRAHRMRGQH